MIELRESQKGLLQQVQDRIGSGIRRILIQLETGGGKTIIAGAITKSLVKFFAERNQSGCYCLYLVHREELVNQVVGTLTQFGMGDHIGIIQGKHPVKPWAHLQVSTVQTLVNRIDVYDWLRPKVIFPDEAHHMMAASWTKIVDYYKGVYVIGLTATPARLDKKGLERHFDAMVEGPTTLELVKEKSLCPIECYSIESSIDLSKMKKSRGDYSIKDRQSRSTPKFRADIVDNYNRYCRGRKVLHFANSISDSLDVVERMRQLSVSAAHVDGDTPKGERAATFASFDAGHITFLSNYEIATEGIDIPSCDAIMVSRKTASVVLWRQMVGRGRRYKPDGRNCILVDLVGNLEEHEHPDEQPEWTLEDGFVGYKKKDKGEKGSIGICNDCGYMYEKRMGVCPSCGGSGGHKKSIEDVKAELKKVELEEKNKRKTQRRNMLYEVRESNGNIEKLREIQHKYGCRPGIVHVWSNVYQGYWNNKLAREKAYEEISEWWGK